MEQVAAAVDAETYRKLKGFRCHVDKCGRLVPGYVNELKTHFQQNHPDILTSNVAKIPFLCSECGAVLKRFKHFKQHIQQFHPLEKFIQQVPPKLETVSSLPCTDDSSTSDEPACSPDYSGINNLSFFKPAVSVLDMESLAENAALKMRCDVGLPESKIQEFMKTSIDLLEHSERFFLGIFKSFLLRKNISYDDEDVIRTINKFKIPSLFANVAKPKDSLCCLAGKAGYPVPAAQEVVLGQSVVTKATKVLSQVRGCPNTIVKRIKKVKDAVHYISIVDTLALVLQNSHALESIQNEEPQNGVLCGFKDGERFKTHKICG